VKKCPNFAFVLMAAIFILTLGTSTCRASFHRKEHTSHDLREILQRMNDSSKRLKTVSADLAYITVTVLVNDQSEEDGEMFYRKGKTPDILIHIQKPGVKFVLFHKNRGEVYSPSINQVQEYNLDNYNGLVEQFMLLGFGTDTESLKKAYEIRLLREEELNDDTTAVLELTPKDSKVAAQLSKIDLWVSEESWLPVQQKVYQPNGNYLLAKYTKVKVNRELPSSTFEIPYEKGVERVKMR
jgi:outer membrane lipoprotein-sorting protein